MKMAMEIGKRKEKKDEMGKEGKNGKKKKKNVFNRKTVENRKA